jgi:hypothetical protein
MQACENLENQNMFLVIFTIELFHHVAYGPPIKGNTSSTAASLFSLRQRCNHVAVLSFAVIQHQYRRLVFLFVRPFSNMDWMFPSKGAPSSVLISLETCYINDQRSGEFLFK